MPGTVTRVGIRARSPAVLEVAERLKALLDDGVGRLAPELGDQRDATGVVLVGRVVEATWPRRCGCLIHRGSRPWRDAGGEERERVACR